jgi:hypothetical protein
MPASDCRAIPAVATFTLTRFSERLDVVLGADSAGPLHRNTLDFRPFKQEKELVHQLNGEIWFVRHAESEANVRRIYANIGDSFPLTERGFEQVKALASQLSAFNISAVYASPLLRAVQTAEEICRLKKIEVKLRLS